MWSPVSLRIFGRVTTSSRLSGCGSGRDGGGPRGRGRRRCCGCCRCCGSCRCSGRGRCRRHAAVADVLVDVIEHVFACDATTGARTRDRGGIEPVLGDEPAHHGREELVAGVTRRCRRCGCCGNLNEVAPSGIVGRRIKFSKDGAFVTDDDGQEVPKDTVFAALCDQTFVGFMKFNGDGVMPDVEMGLLYSGLRNAGAREPRRPRREPVGARPGRHAAGRPVATSSCICRCRTPRRSRCSPSTPRRGPAAALSAICCGTTTAWPRPRPARCRWCGCGPAGSSTRTRRVGLVPTPMFVVVRASAGQLRRQAGHVDRRHSR